MLQEHKLSFRVIESAVFHMLGSGNPGACHKVILFVCCDEWALQITGNIIFEIKDILTS